MDAVHGADGEIALTIGPIELGFIVELTVEAKPVFKAQVLTAIVI